MSQTVERDARQEPSADRRRWIALAVVALAHLMIVIDMTIVNVALPSIRDDLGIIDAQRHWVITAYTLPFGGLLLLGGRISDRIRRKDALLIGLLGFAAASALGGAASSLEMLLAARALQGAFAALLAPAALSLLAVTFTDPKERAKAFGVFGTVVGAGSPLGLLAGGVLAGYATWNWVFYVNIPIAVGVAALAMVCVSTPSGARKSGYDIPGAILVTGALTAIVYGFTVAPEEGWAAAPTLGSLAAGAVLLAVFLVVESKVRDPLLPLRILRDRGRGGAYLLILLMMTGPFGAYLFVSFYLQGVQQYSPLRTGLAFLPLSLGVIASSTTTSKLISKVRTRLLMGSGLFVAAAGMALLTRLAADSAYVTDVLPSLIMIGIGMGMVVPPAVNLATHAVQPTEAGVASAMFNVSQQVGASIGTALLNTVAAGTTAAYLAAHVGAGADAERQGQIEGYGMATLTGAVILAIAGILAYTLINTRLDAPKQAPDRASNDTKES